MDSIFSYKTHFEYLLERLDPRKHQRGIKIKLAQFLRVTPGYISQALAGKINLTLEQADLANSFLEHSIDESEFFILLVSRDRAGTTTLKDHYSKQINKIIKKRMEVSAHLDKKLELSPLAQSIYYSSWLYPAIHVAVTIPKLRRIHELINFFHITKDNLLMILEFLESNGLVVKTGENIMPTQNWVRVDRGSPFFNQTHRIWREITLRVLDQNESSNLHYSGIFSIDDKVAEQVRKELLSTIRSSVGSFQSAQEEHLQVFSLDFYKLPPKK